MHWIWALNGLFLLTWTLSSLPQHISLACFISTHVPPEASLVLQREEIICSCFSYLAKWDLVHGVPSELVAGWRNEYVLRKSFI
jgi:hypothetical protein